MTEIGKILIGLGAVVLVVGVVLLALGRVGFKGLPGDIRYEGQNVRFYFPIVTCLLISIGLTAGMWLWRWFNKR